MSKPVIAFLGTGIMGLPMCGHLLDAGFPVRAWNRTRAKAEALLGKGATLPATVAEAVADADFVIIMLSTGPVVSEILFGQEAAAAALKAGSTVVVMSSIPVENSREHAKKLLEKGVHYVDAPVSGGEKGAIEASLTIMAGGGEEVIAGAGEVLACMGRVTRVGPVGSGQLAKLANQAIVGITIGAVAEALLLAEAGGADPSAVRDALLGGFADSAILRQHGTRMISGNFEPGGKSEMQLKDLETARRLADSLGLELPALELAESLYRQMCEAGLGALDHSALILHLRNRD
jgi:3-hydroxyisobutyrate dehydrogenase-like beta-hydroxyacid dehydrogenase